VIHEALAKQKNSSAADCHSSNKLVKQHSINMESQQGGVNYGNMPSEHQVFDNLEMSNGETTNRPTGKIFQSKSTHTMVMPNMKYHIRTNEVGNS
jgi:hypothetical protein